MIEAVNIALQASPLVRGNAEQVSALESTSANPARTQKIAQAGTTSPYVYVDVNFDKAILQLRNPDGDVVDQIPSESQLEARARDLAREAAGQTVEPASPQVSSASRNASSQALVEAQAAASEASAQAAAVNTQQQAAFAAAARAGNSNAGAASVSISA